MFHSLSLNLVRPNLPLRKPSSSPMAPTASPLPGQPSASTASPVQGAIGGGRSILSGLPLLPISRDPSLVFGSPPSVLPVDFCNLCGEQGNFRCKRCKETHYCSVVCQIEDWKAHRRMCKSIDPETAEDAPKETTASPGPGDKSSQAVNERGDSPGLQRVYLKDLQIKKIIKGTEIQAFVVGFHSPGRFFILPQSPELLEALTIISKELKRMYSCPSSTAYAPCVGEVCAVQFSSDLNWYRGLVQTLSADQKMAKVLYIDFGNEEDVSVDKIKPLTANMLPYCPCVMECTVAGVQPVSGVWSGDCCSSVRQMLAGKTLTVRLVETQNSGHIHVVDVRLSTGKQLSTFLIEHGYAKEEELNVPPTEQELNAMVSTSLENLRFLSNSKDDNSWAQPPQPLTQAVGDSLSVMVTHIQSPDEIVVQKVENAGVIQNLQLKLREHCSQISAPPNFRPAPGTVCCAQFSEDKQWYRAKILTYPSEKCVCVGYLDFGNSEVVDLGHLRPIKDTLLALPMQAMPCGLAGIKPVGESWSQDCLLPLQQRVSNRLLRIEIQGAHEGKFLVTMIDEASDPQANVAELLTAAGFAAPVPITSSETQVDQKESAAAAKQQECSPAPAPACEPLVWSSTELPCDGQTVALLASAVENPQEFYCHINNHADHQCLLELLTQLKQHCEANDTIFTPKLGEPCCARLPGVQKWYRAMVKGLSEDKVSVLLVDFGNSMEVVKKHLRPITPQLLTLPFQAIRCCLAGVEPKGSKWSSEARLWFQTMVVGEQLRARVISVTERGYNVALESGGQDVAAALISEQLARAPGGIPKETHETTSSLAKQEKIQEDDPSQIQANPSSQAFSSKETLAEAQTEQTSDPSFPVNWKTVELQVNLPFQPLTAAIISPTHFYVLGQLQVDHQKLQGFVTELTAYCSTNQASLSSAVLSRPSPGAACCAQFSVDKNWHRAVVLEVGEDDVSVVYADYGNTEKLPLSGILPIPVHLLQLPFVIVRCTLTGKEHFPDEWPEEVQQLFKSLLLSGVTATVESFDGFANVLSVTLPTERGGGNLTAKIMDALLAHTKNNPSPSTSQKPEQTGDGWSSTGSTTVVPDCPQPKSIPEVPKLPENAKCPTDITAAQEPVPQTLQQMRNPSAIPVNDPVGEIIREMEFPCRIDPKISDLQTYGCYCLSLEIKIDQLEKLMQQQLSLIEQLVAQKK